MIIIHLLFSINSNNKMFKFIKNFKTIVEKIFTFIGCLIIYIIGISLGRIIFSFSKKRSNNHWQKIDVSSNMETMY